MHFRALGTYYSRNFFLKKLTLVAFVSRIASQYVSIFLKKTRDIIQHLAIIFSGQKSFQTFQKSLLFVFAVKWKEADEECNHYDYKYEPEIFRWTYEKGWQQGAWTQVAYWAQCVLQVTSHSKSKWIFFEMLIYRRGEIFWNKGTERKENEIQLLYDPQF